MLKTVSHFILKLLGWRLDKRIPKEKKYVLIAAHHTSNWDFIYGVLAKWALDEPYMWVGKHTLFWGLLNYVFRKLGGIPVDRRAHHGFIEQMVHEFDQRDELKLAMAPEGTRSKVAYWKTGFYYIARQAKVPVAFGYFDYKSKIIGVHGCFYPCGDIEKDMQIVKEFYCDKTGKHPANEGTIRLNPDTNK